MASGNDYLNTQASFSALFELSSVEVSLILTDNGSMF